MIQIEKAQHDSRRLVAIRRHERVRAGLLLFAGVVAVLFLSLWHPAGWVPECPVHQHTGLYCPGCGSVRATHHLLNGRFGEALRHNPMLIVLGVPLAIWFWSEQVMMVIGGYRFAPIFRKAIIAWVVLGALLLFTLVRNLPSDRFELLRPPDLVEDASP